MSRADANSLFAWVESQIDKAKSAFPSFRGKMYGDVLTQMYVVQPGFSVEEGEGPLARIDGVDFSQFDMVAVTYVNGEPLILGKILSTVPDRHYMWIPLQLHSRTGLSGNFANVALEVQDSQNRRAVDVFAVQGGNVLKIYGDYTGATPNLVIGQSLADAPTDYAKSITLNGSTGYGDFTGGVRITAPAANDLLLVTNGFLDYLRVDGTTGTTSVGGLYAEGNVTAIGNLSLTGTATLGGAVTETVNSATALTVRKTSATTDNVFVVDTTNKEVELRNGAKLRLFSNNGTIEQASIDASTGAAGFKGRVNLAGLAAVNAPTATLSALTAVAGTGATATARGYATDTAGVVTITSGSAPSGTGAFGRVTFSAAKANSNDYAVIISSGNGNGSRVLTVERAAGYFNVHTSAALAASTEYVFHYLVVDLV